MFDDIKQNIKDWDDDEEIMNWLLKRPLTVPACYGEARGLSQDPTEIFKSHVGILPSQVEQNSSFTQSRLSLK